MSLPQGELVRRNRRVNSLFANMFVYIHVHVGDRSITERAVFK